MSKTIQEAIDYLSGVSRLTESSSALDELLLLSKKISSTADKSEITKLVGILGNFTIEDSSVKNGFILLKSPKLKNHLVLITGRRYQGKFDDDTNIEEGNNKKIPIGSFIAAKPGHVLVNVTNDDPDNKSYLYDGDDSLDVPIKNLNVATKPLIHSIKKMIDPNYKKLGYNLTVTHFMLHAHDQ